MRRFEAERSQDLDEVFEWYELQMLLLNEEERRLPHLLTGVDSREIPRRQPRRVARKVRFREKAFAIFRHATLAHYHRSFVAPGV